MLLSRYARSSENRRDACVFRSSLQSPNTTRASALRMSSPEMKDQMKDERSAEHGASWQRLGTWNLAKRAFCILQNYFHSRCQSHRAPSESERVRRGDGPRGRRGGQQLPLTLSLSGLLVNALCTSFYFFLSGLGHIPYICIYIYCFRFHGTHHQSPQWQSAFAFPLFAVRSVTHAQCTRGGQQWTTAPLLKNEEYIIYIE
jgi:hypothetical protein